MRRRMSQDLQHQWISTMYPTQGGLVKALSLDQHHGARLIGGEIDAQGHSLKLGPVIPGLHRGVQGQRDAIGSRFGDGGPQAGAGRELVQDFQGHLPRAALLACRGKFRQQRGLGGEDISAPLVETQIVANAQRRQAHVNVLMPHELGETAHRIAVLDELILALLHPRQQMQKAQRDQQQVLGSAADKKHQEEVPQSLLHDGKFNRWILPLKQDPVLAFLLVELPPLICADGGAAGDHLPLLQLELLLQHLPPPCFILDDPHGDVGALVT
mmetsp:Transcript_51747/g.150368  ORF Transcript_51747/g.150368 Transcript_51747/m.150368 type:complete len:270 (+) Transcript_51747:1195-2004(+)